MFRQGLFLLSWFGAGGLTFYCVMLRSENRDLSEELTAQQDFQQRYQEQLTVNVRQREDFEVQIQQLQNNLSGAQIQMSNLSEALQEAREMMVPATQQVIEQLAGDADQ